MPVSSRGYFAMAKETTLGTPEPRDATLATNYPAYWAYPVEEVEFVPAKEFIDFKEIRGSRQAYTTLDGPFRPTAMIKGAVYPGAALGQFLQGAFGDSQVINKTTATATDTATYLYDFTGSYNDDTDANIATETAFFDGNNLPSFTLERSDGRDGSATIVEQLSGCKVESVQFTANFGEKVDMTVNFQATKKPAKLGDDLGSAARYKFDKTVANKNQSSANRIFYPGQGEVVVNGEYQEYDITPLYFNRAAIKIDNTATNSAIRMKTLSWEMTNTLTRQETLRATVAGDGFNLNPVTDAFDMFEGGVECTLTGTAVFDSLDLYNKMLDGSNIYFELWLGSDTVADAGDPTTTVEDAYHGLYFYWPKLKVSRASIPFTAGEVIESDVEFKVIYAPSAVLGRFDERISASDTGAPYKNATTNIVTGGSMFSKMISRMPSKNVSSKDRPIFY